MQIDTASFSFILKSLEPLFLPPYQGSTLRGGFGFAFKRAAYIMKLRDVKAIARKMNLEVTHVNKTDLIRAIQRSEGNSDCFKTGYVHDCGQLNCLWRQDCFK